MGSLNIAATAMLAQQFNVDVISNNIANLNTTAFKRQRAEFNDLIYQTRSSVGSQSSDTGTLVVTGAQFGTGVKVGSVYRIHEQGNMLSTGNSFDLAIQGKGFTSSAVQPLGRICLPSQTPPPATSRPINERSRAEITMPPPQCPPPGTESIGLPSMVTLEVL